MNLILPVVVVVSGTVVVASTVDGVMVVVSGSVVATGLVVGGGVGPRDGEPLGTLAKTITFFFFSRKKVFVHFVFK